MINWKVRIKNPVFWITLIPALLILIQLIAGLFGLTVDFNELSDKLIQIVKAIFVVLAILGIVVDPTTAGVDDSELAMTYEEPKKP